MQLSLLRLFCLAFLVAFLPGTAFAEGYALYEYSARGIALGGAMTARKPDASALAYNPALITRLPGKNVMAGMSTVSPKGKMDSTDSNGNSKTTSLREATWVIPHFYYTQQLTDTLTFGAGSFSRFGLGFEYPHNWPGRFNIYEASLTTFSVNPNLAWAATDKLSLAAGVEVMYANLDLKKRVEVSAAGSPLRMEVDSNIQNASDTALGWNLAGHYQFNDMWAVGLLYRSQVRVHAKGDVEYTMVGHNLPGSMNGTAQGAFNQVFRDGKAHSTVYLPDSYTGGIAFTPLKNLSFEFAATYTRWSSFRNLNIHLPQPVGESRTKEHWKDVWRLGFGVEYSPVEWLDLRAGYVWDQSPMTDRYQSYLVPTDDRNIWSLGVGFNWDAWNLDLAYAFIDAKSRHYKASSETHVLDSNSHASNSTHIASVSLSYKF